VCLSEYEYDVESNEDHQDEEDLEHESPVAGCIFVQLSQLILCTFNVVQGFFRINVDPVDQLFMTLHDCTEAFKQGRDVGQRLFNRLY
jgi:hypothetical protein